MSQSQLALAKRYTLGRSPIYRRAYFQITFMVNDTIHCNPEYITMSYICIRYKIIHLLNPTFNKVTWQRQGRFTMCIIMYCGLKTIIRLEFYHKDTKFSLGVAIFNNMVMRWGGGSSQFHVLSRWLKKTLEKSSCLQMVNKSEATVQIEMTWPGVFKVFHSDPFSCNNLLSGLRLQAQYK